MLVSYVYIEDLYLYLLNWVNSKTLEEQSGHLFVRKCYCIRFDNIDLLSAIII